MLFDSHDSSRNPVNSSSLLFRNISPEFRMLQSWCSFSNRHSTLVQICSIVFSKWFHRQLEKSCISLPWKWEFREQHVQPAPPGGSEVSVCMLTQHVVSTHGAERSNQTLKWSCSQLIISPTVRSIAGWVGADQSYWWLQILLLHYSQEASTPTSGVFLCWVYKLMFPPQSVASHWECLFAFPCGPAA